MIHDDYSNSKNVTAQSLKEQAENDARLLRLLRQADDEAFHGRPEWNPTTNLEDSMDQQIKRSQDQLDQNRRLLGKA